MSNLVCFGLGYSAEHFVGLYGDGFARIVATVRGAERHRAGETDPDVIEEWSAALAGADEGL